MSEFKTVFDVLENYAYDLSKHVTKNGDEKDESAINQSIENILLTNFGERVFRPNFGSNLLLQCLVIYYHKYNNTNLE